MQQGIKALLARALPESALQAIRKLHYARALRHAELSEEPDLGVAIQLVRPGDRAIDLGANVGLYTLFLSRAVGERGLVCAVEPVPPTHDLLAYTTRSLGLHNVRLLQSAASGSEGTVTMQIPHFEWGGENLYQARIVGGSRSEGQRSFTVPTRTLDSIADELGSPITFVKCDVEGHELVCVQSARRLLERERPAWLIEVSSDPDAAGSQAGALFGLLALSGYRAFRWDGSRLVPRRPGDRSVNYFFLAPAHLERLRERDVPADPA
jgi:FkbM family methyltransferase